MKKQTRALSTVPGNHSKVSIEQATKSLKGLGYERIAHVPKTSFTDSSMAVIIPSREPHLQIPFVQALQSLMYPMNQRRFMFFVTGAEVGQAYDDQVAGILAHPELGTVKYVLTLEDDTLPPPDAILKLVESIELGPFDGVGGLYHTKGDFNMPMAYGDPAEFARTGVLDFRPRNIVQALQHGEIMEVNGIANGCSLFRAETFKRFPRPWFQTLNKMGEGAMTQDLFWCAKARRGGARFAVDMRVCCAHMDWSTGTAY